MKKFFGVKIRRSQLRCWLGNCCIINATNERCGGLLITGSDFYEIFMCLNVADGGIDLLGLGKSKSKWCKFEYHWSE